MNKITGSMYLTPLSTVEEALELAIVRNDCRDMMTNNREEITPEQQRLWYKTKYLIQEPQRYKIWLLKSETGEILGYFASRQEGSSQFITEGIKKQFRGKGLGSFILEIMLKDNSFKHSLLFADIFRHNIPSINLHKKFGFLFHSEVTHEILRYKLLC